MAFSLSKYAHMAWGPPANAAWPCADVDKGDVMEQRSAATAEARVLLCAPRTFNPFARPRPFGIGKLEKEQRIEIRKLKYKGNAGVATLMREIGRPQNGPPSLPVGMMASPR